MLHSATYFSTCHSAKSRWTLSSGRWAGLAFLRPYFCPEKCCNDNEVLPSVSTSFALACQATLKSTHAPGLEVHRSPSPSEDLVALVDH